MTNLTNTQKFHRKMWLILYGINGVINLNAGLTADGFIPKVEMNYND